MRLYSGSSEQFIQDVRDNRIADIMANTFQFRFGRSPSYEELNSWQNSLPRVRDLIEVAGLSDNIIALEYEVPYNQNRIDCLLFGKGNNDCSNIVLIELKQWSSVNALEEEGNFVETYTGGAERVVPHPSQQAKGYHNYLKSFVSEFENQPPLMLFSCSYCHNYKRKEADGLFDPVYQPIVDEFPVFTKEDVHKLANKIKDLLFAGEGFEIFNRFMQSPIRPSKKLLENVSKVIKNEVVFSLLNEQLEAKNLILAKIRKADKSKEKSIIIVHGGPGTGKSVIAINLLAEVAQRGKKVFYGCKSKPFIEGLKRLVGNDGEMLFSNLYRFLPTRIKENELDLLLIDEAHRIEKKSNHQYTKKQDRTEMPQIDQIIRCAKTAVFFIDDKQNVRSQEIGSSELIRDTVGKLGYNLFEVTLNTQYRCMGSNDYLLWLESALGYTNKKRTLRKNEVFDFKILNSPQEIYDIIKKKESEKPNSARMVAGFCWSWSKKLDADGNLVNDVVIGDFAMPWETHGQITRPPKGFVKWYEWAYRPEGVKQIGCIYTAQGFEFDYIGVIIGNDLIYDPKTDSLKADITATKDPTLKKGKETFENHVKNIYRTLLSRGMKGCYVYFVDKATESFFKSRIEKAERIDEPKVLMYSDLVKDRKVVSIHDRILSSINQEDKFREYLPVYSLKAAAGKFGEGSDVHEEGWIEVNIKKKLNKNMFVAKVVGHSMEPLIPNNSYCIFNAQVLGSRQGKIVLVQHHDIADIDTRSSYTVKKYRSKKQYNADGSWQHEEIILEPLNNKYKPIMLINNNEDEFNVIAEFIALVK